jgi:diguanylate cyclase (GGDEF)-like protein/PAS domain S-box-containing protein
MRFDYRAGRNPLVFLAAFLAVAGATWAWWPSALTQAASQNYAPLGFCYRWNKQLLTLHIVSDSIIFLSYLSIAFSLGWLVYRQRRQIPFAWIFVAFGMFIVACGFTHAMDVFVIWYPYYWVAGDIKLVTAIASVITAIALPSLLPRIGHLLEEAKSSRRNEHRFRSSIDFGNDAFFIFESVRDAAGEIVDFRFDVVNEKGAEMISGTPQGLKGQSLCDHYPVNRANGLFERYKHVVNTGETFEDEVPFNVEAIKASWLFLRVLKVDDGVAIVTTNISERKKSELELVRSVTFTRSIIASSPFATIVTDLKGTITAVNPAAERMLWYTKEALIDTQTPLILLDPREVAARASALSQELQTAIEPGMKVLMAKPDRGQVEEAEWKLVRRDGSRFDAHVTVSALTDAGGVIIGLMLIAYDITERKRAEEYMSHIAHHDSMTGLPTRSLFHDRLSVAIARAKRYRNKIALLLVDIDHLKRANDLMGQHIGDELLMHVVRRLKASVRGSDTVARMGGDEFVVMLSDLSDVHEAEVIAGKLIETMLAPIEIEGQTLIVTVSIGICLYPDSGGSDETLLKNADLALYHAKALGRNRRQTFTPEMASASSRRRLLERGLRDAIQLNELEVVYQPQVSLKTGKVTGIEALLRWRSGRLGMVMPTEFIPVAEESGLIVPIGEWVLQTACRDGRQLQLDLGRPLIIAVNISPRQFQQDYLPRIVRETLAQCDLDANTLELEITENILISDSQKAMDILEEVRSFGVRLTIDDFGTGFSSMSYVMRFRVDRLKIDQSFIRNMTTNSDSKVVTSAIINLARGLNIQVVAEGVESIAHRDVLIAEGCDEAQGYLYSKPVPVRSLEAAIQKIEEAEAPEPHIDAAA